MSRVGKKAKGGAPPAFLLHDGHPTADPALVELNFGAIENPLLCLCREKRVAEH